MSIFTDFLQVIQWLTKLIPKWHFNTLGCRTSLWYLTRTSAMHEDYKQVWSECKGLFVAIIIGGKRWDKGYHTAKGTDCIPENLSDIVKCEKDWMWNFGHYTVFESKLHNCIMESNYIHPWCSGCILISLTNYVTNSCQSAVQLRYYCTLVPTWRVKNFIKICPVPKTTWTTINTAKVIHDECKT